MISLKKALLLSVFLLSLVYYASDNTPFLGDSDPSWHIMAGRQILELGHIPESDSWSYEAGKTRWYNLSWAFDVGLSKAYDLLGLDGLKLLWMILGSGLIALVSYICLMLRASWFVIIPCACLMLGVAFESMCIRPQMVTYYLSLIFYLILLRFRQKPTDKYVYFLPMLMILWVNCHGGFLAGFTIIAAFTAESLYHKEKQKALLLAGLGAACLVATLLNPYNMSIVEGISRTLGTTASKYITEWRGMAIPGDIGMTIYFVAFLVSVQFTSPRIHLAEKLLAGFWLVAGVASIRNFHITALLATPFLALSLSEIIAKVRKTDGRDYLLEFLSHKKTPALLITLISVTIVSLAIPTTFTSFWHIESGLHESLRTAEELAFIEKHYPKLKLFNDYDLGGNIIFESGGRQKVFIDSRAETAYSSAYMEDYFKIYKATAYNDQLLKQYGIEIMLLKSKTPIADYITAQPEWVKVLTNGRKLIFVRKSKADAHTKL